MASTETSKLISEGHESYELMLSMLTGIRTAGSKFASLPLQRALTSADFNQKWDGDFVARGTSETPAHRYADFQFKDYAPLVFRQLRERFGIAPCASAAAGPCVGEQLQELRRLREEDQEEAARERQEAAAAAARLERQLRLGRDAIADSLGLLERPAAVPEVLAPGAATRR